MEPNFEISLVYRKEGKLISIDKVQGESLVEVLSKFVLQTTQLQENIFASALREAIRFRDDDIPF